MAPRSRTNHARPHRFCHTRCPTSTTCTHPSFARPAGALGWADLRTEVGDPLGERLRGRAPSPADLGSRVFPLGACRRLGEEASIRAPLVAPAAPSRGGDPVGGERRAPQQEPESRFRARPTQSSGSGAGGLTREDRLSKSAPRRAPPSTCPRCHPSNAGSTCLAGIPAGVPGEPEGRAPGDRECLLFRTQSRRDVLGDRAGSARGHAH